jgi:hypothetical protein
MISFPPSLSFFPCLSYYDVSHRCWSSGRSLPPILTSPWRIAVRPCLSLTGVPLPTATVIQWTELLHSNSQLWICTTAFLLPTICNFSSRLMLKETSPCSDIYSEIDYLSSLNIYIHTNKWQQILNPNPLGPEPRLASTQHVRTCWIATTKHVRTCWFLWIATTKHVRTCLIPGKIKQAEERQIVERRRERGRADP